MINKALFKQSAKANFNRWLTITLATSFILVIILVVLSQMGAISGVKDSLTQIFTNANSEAVFKENAVDSYNLYLTSLDVQHKLDGLANGNQTLGEEEDTLRIVWNTVTDEYEIKLENFESENGRVPTEEEKEEIRLSLAPELIEWSKTNEIDISSLGTSEEEIADGIVCLLKAYDGNDIQFGEDAGQFFTQTKDILIKAYEYKCYNLAFNQGMNMTGATEDFGNLVAVKTVAVVKNAMASYRGDGSEGSYNQASYQEDAQSSILALVYDLSQYIVPTEYNEQEGAQFRVSIKVLSNSAISTYQMWLDEGLSKEDARAQATASLTEQIPEGVAKALKELGEMDIAGLVIGSMFFKMAGLLLPLMFVINTANGLISGQVDSGSMAYVLSTPTKRRTVTCTQMIYLVSSLFVMYAILFLTNVVTLACVGTECGLNYGQLALLCLGSFFTSFAFAGFCFMCSAIFNRVKHSMSYGGGISLMMLVCTILGLFGSSAMPEMMRISAMNAFNYISIISFFDTTAILGGTLGYLWKFALLVTIGVTCFIIGILRFDKKDLPL